MKNGCNATEVKGHMSFLFQSCSGYIYFHPDVRNSDIGTCMKRIETVFHALSYINPMLPCFSIRTNCACLQMKYFELK